MNALSLMKTSMRIFLFILGSILVLKVNSRGDNIVTAAAADNNLSIPTSSQSEPTCECPPDLSDQLRASLMTDCNSKLTELRAYIQEHQTKIDQCHSQHATYVVNTNKAIESADAQFENCAAQTSTLEEKQLELRSEISSLIDSKSIQNEEYANSIFKYNEKLSVSVEEITQCHGETNKCRSDYNEELKKHELLQKENVRLEYDKDKYHQKMAECQSDYNEALQSQKSLQRNHDHLKSLHESKIKTMQKEQMKLNKEIGRLKKGIKTEQDRYHEERDHANRIEKVIRIMRQNAEVTYVNTTLMKRDIVRFTSFNFKRAYAIYDSGKLKVLQHPTFEYVDTKAWDFYSMTIARSEHVYSILKDINKSHCTPIIDQMMISIQGTSFWETQGVVGIEKVAQIFKSIFLTLVSAVQQTTAVGLDYIELTKGDDDAEDSWFVGIIVWNLEYMKNNADCVANISIAGIVIFMLAPFLVAGVLRFLFRSILFVLTSPFRPFLMVRQWMSKE